MMKNERGFTIMELLVVIVIIGVLAAIGVPAYNNLTERARTTACNANKRTLEAAAGMYYADTGNYPADKSAPESWLDPNSKPYIDNAASFECPKDNGKYSWDVSKKAVVCSVHDAPAVP